MAAVTLRGGLNRPLTNAEMDANFINLNEELATKESAQYVATFGPGVGTAAITEAGIFNAASAGTMLARTAFPVINKGALDTLTLTWKVTVA